VPRRHFIRRGLTIPVPRRAAITTLVLAVVVFVSGLVAVSPLALRLLSRRSTDWEQLSWVGQTYGAASALLAVLALIGVTVSLFMQARDAKANREQGLRAIHTELLQMAMDDELYRRSWGPFFASADPDAQRAHMYVNMIISTWQMQYELDAISEEHLRATAYLVFSGEIGQRFWSDARNLRLQAVSTRRERRFHEILDEEYKRALESPAVVPSAGEQPVRRPEHGSPAKTLRRFIGWIGAGVGLAVTLGLLRRHRTHRP
jgi:hypothetical protein